MYSLFVTSLLVLRVATLLLQVTMFGQMEITSFAIERASQTSDIPTVSFCELINSQDKYKNKIVRVRATYITSFEWTALYDLKCADKNKKPEDKYIRPTLDCEVEKTCKALQMKLINGLHHSSGNRVELLMTGQLTVKTQSGGATFIGDYPLIFIIKSIEETLSISPGTPSPWDNR